MSDRRHALRGWRWAILIAACSALPSSTDAAQYFGQNKVQYKHLEFRILRTEHFDIYFSDDHREAADLGARLAERWYARLSRVLAHTLLDRQPLVLYGSHPDFEQTNVVPDRLGEGVGGLTEPLRRRMVLPFAGPLADTDHVIGHELVHAFQFDMAAGVGGGLDRLPLWFVEGMAEYCSLGPADPATAMWLRDAMRTGTLPSLKDLDNPRYFPYRWGHAFWAFVAGRWGDDVMRRLFTVAADAGVDEAVQIVLGLSPEALAAEWHAAIGRAYPRGPEIVQPAARRLIGGTGPGAGLNVGPAISPDGRWIVFLSGRSLFSVDLYVADTATGRIVHKLTNMLTSAHVSSLQFISSAGAWDPQGRRFAVAAVAAGRAALVLFNATSWRQERQIEIPDVDEVFNPTWSPDGRAICFTGLRHGVMDLYVYDLVEPGLRRLTNDAYADLHPAWSPDGRRIVFSTDRFTTELETLASGRYRLAVIDVAAGRIQPLTPGAGGDGINPQWSGDGDVYFVSDRTGVPNLYHVRLDSGEVTPMTSVATGVSGITPTSPSMSMAAGNGTASFSVFEGGRYDIHVLDLATRGERVEALAAGAILPPIDRRPGQLARLLANPAFGLPAQTTFPVVKYAPTLSLDRPGQVLAGAAVGGDGPAASGALAFSFGDALNNRQLSTVLQASSGLTRGFTLNETAAQVAYVNQSRRWMWGAAANQFPFVSGALLLGRDGADADVGVSETMLFRQVERAAVGVAAYPFTHAARAEVMGGTRDVAFDRVVETTRFSLTSGEALGRSTDTTALAAPLRLGTYGAAFVFDTTDFGATSPVRGQRYRLETTAAAGTISFTNLLADYRQYVMPAPFYTVAIRILHQGRYGSGAEDARLLPSFVGHPRLVRGYDLDLVGLCVPGVASPCAVNGRLLGSRMLVGNLEFRMPLLRPFGVSPRMYGPVPVEFAVFADAGAVWNRGQRPVFLGGSRPGISSAGAAVRVNLVGVTVAEFSASRPFQRQERGWVLQFGLAPGF